MNSKLNSLLNFLFPCPHRRTTFPMSKIKERRVGLYIRCLDCGKKLPYSWPGVQVSPPDPVPPVQLKEALHA